MNTYMATKNTVFNRVHIYHDDVDKLVADFLASKLKEHRLKDVCSLLKG